jgi:hypothetical protein
MQGLTSTPVPSRAACPHRPRDAYAVTLAVVLSHRHLRQRACLHPESSATYISTPTPAGGVGHGAVCGPNPNLPDGSALVGPVDSDDSLLVDGLTSCATMEKFATIAYSHLKA